MVTGGTATFGTGFWVQAALRQSATHKGIHRFSMQIGTLPGSRWMFAKGMKGCQIGGSQACGRSPATQFRNELLAPASIGCGVAAIDLGPLVCCDSCRIRKVRS
jgi:hypothetical protein